MIIVTNRTTNQFSFEYVDGMHSTLSQKKARLVHEKGFTLVELIVVIAIVALLAGIVLPGMSGIVTRSSIETAQQDLMQSLRKAKIVARNRNTRVTITLVKNSNVINLSSSDGSYNQNSTMPSSTTPNASNTFVFSPMGLIDKTGTITIVSSRDATLTRSITIQTLFGQMAAN